MGVALLIRDPHSGAYSRAFFDEIIERELERARRHGVVLSVMSVVLSDWDAFVHAEPASTVDGVVRTIANTLLTNLRLTDFLFRWEDDEFLALLVEADLEACKLKVARLGGRSSHGARGRAPRPGRSRYAPEPPPSLGTSSSRASSRSPALPRATRPVSSPRSGFEREIDAQLPGEPIQRSEEHT